MRFVSILLPGLIAACTAAGPAAAMHLIMPDDRPQRYDGYESPMIAQPWVNRQNNLAPTERPIGEIIATRLGLVNGSAELFRFRVEGAPSNKTMLDGMVDGGGIKLKLSW
ncbi:MAG: hypothetical protein WDM91_16975 [Rhizomicrobium sp.]